MKDKIAALLAKARLATPGPWFPFCTDADECDQPSGVKGKELVVEGFYPHENSGIAMPDDTRYIAACDPTTITELCQVLLEARDILEFLVDTRSDLDGKEEDARGWLAKWAKPVEGENAK